jgi:carboxypeptidase C (cathepsin A)
VHYGADKRFEPSISITWNFQHSNAMPDLANAMKINPTLKVQLNAGYFDLATPFYRGIYEMHHLPIPASLQSNIEYRLYDSGHMVYAKEESLQLLHANVADFIHRTGSATH